MLTATMSTIAAGMTAASRFTAGRKAWLCVILVGDRAGILAMEDPAKAVLHSLIGQPIAAGCKGVAMLAVALVRIRIPGAAAHALDQRGADAVTLDGQRVIGVSDIDLLHTFHVSAGIVGSSRRGGKSVDHDTAHLRSMRTSPGIELSLARN
jgi:hypothetical protein